MNIALLLSGGTGSRLGSSLPKQYIEAGGRKIISYSLETLLRAGEIDCLWLAAHEEWQQDLLEIIDKYDTDHKFRGFSAPGATRQLSIYKGLTAIKETLGQGSAGAAVLIHDAARPCLTGEDITGYFKALPGYDGVLPVLPMKDTVYFSKDGNAVDSLLDRACIYAGQAPEIFNFEKYLSANEELVKNGRIMAINGSAEAAVIGKMNIAMVKGNENNFKITTQADLDSFLQRIK